MRPNDVIDAGIAAHRRLLASVDALDDDAFAGASKLAGWSRAHVVSHLAGNADSHTWMFAGAAVGEVRQQYPSREKRAEGIALGVRETPRELRAHLRGACERLETAWGAFGEEQWDREGIVAVGPRPMHEIAFRRLREVEVHHVDLDAGYAPSQWPDIYIEGELARRLPALRDRADDVALVAWLLGRGEAPELGPW